MKEVSKDLLEFIRTHWEFLAPTLYELLVRVIPTKKNWSIIDHAIKLFGLIIKNRRVESPNDNVPIGDEKVNHVTVKRDKHIISVLLLLALALPSLGQLNGTFKGIRLSPGQDTSTVSYPTGSIIRDLASDSLLYKYPSGWRTISGGGGGGLSSVAWGDITGTLSNQTDLQTDLDAKAPNAGNYVTVTGGNFTLDLTQAYRQLLIDDPDPVDITIPLASSVDFELGTRIRIIWYGVCGGTPPPLGTGAVTLVPTGGVTINSSSGGLTVSNRYSSLVLEKIGTNEWIVSNGTPPSIFPLVSSWALTTVSETFTNQANSQLATAAIGAKIDLNNFSQIKLSIRVGTASASANIPRVYLLYSTNDGSSYSVLGQGTVASGEAVSIAATGYPETDWYDIPVGAKSNVVIRSAINGGDGVADPTIGSQYIQLRQ